MLLRIEYETKYELIKRISKNDSKNKKIISNRGKNDTCIKLNQYFQHKFFFLMILLYNLIISHISVEKKNLWIDLKSEQVSGPENIHLGNLYVAFVCKKYN